MKANKLSTSISSRMPPIIPTIENKKISAKDAGLIAKKYYEDISGKTDQKVVLEEVELSEDEKYWFITIGIYTSTTSPIFLSQGFNERLDYKIFRIDSKTGSVISMKIKQPISVSPSPSISA